MTVRLNPYLSFRDNAREAMEFYHSVLGGELTLSTFAEGGPVSDDPADADKIMHGMLETESGITLMGADTPNSMEHESGGFAVSLSGDDDAALRGYWEALSQSGTVIEPLETAPWGDSFGMCVDRFGVTWMVNIAGSQA
jgi:PhnB protein